MIKPPYTEANFDKLWQENIILKSNEAEKEKRILGLVDDLISIKEKFREFVFQKGLKIEE